MRPTLMLLILLCTLQRAFCQDIITTIHGNKINAKVLRINEHEIEYKPYDNQEGPIHTMQRSEIAVINYPNGAVDSFSTQLSDDNNMSLAEKGTADAKAYYKANGPALGAGISAIYPFYGAIAAVVISSTRPRYENLNFPSYDLMEQPAYRRAYEDKAFRIKKNKTWAGFGIGTGVLASVVAAVLIATMPH